VAMRMKGETPREIAGFAESMRGKAAKVTADKPGEAVDLVGTGGDGKHTFNISTAASFVVAGAGVPVAKHGNRSVSSLSGSADVLSVLGVNINADIPVLERCINECGIAFLMAPHFHPAMRHIAPIRQELGIRTVFNLLGPLANPASPDFQLLGVYHEKWVEPMAHVLSGLGTKAAWVVHGSDGLDELSLSGPSKVAELKDGKVRCFDVSPDEAGLSVVSLEALKGRDPEHNASAMIDALSGVESAYRNAILYNASAGLVIAGKAQDLKQGVEIAKEVVDSGKAHITLKKLVEISHERA